MKTGVKIMLFLLTGIGVPFLFSLPAFGQSELELRDKINNKNKEIQDLEKEIVEFQKQILNVSKQSSSLEQALRALELSRKKLITDITLTQKKIDAVTLIIEFLKGEIKDKEGGICIQKQALRKSIREVSDADQTSLIEAVFKYENLGDFWSEQVIREEIHGAIRDRVVELTELKNELSTAKDETEEKRKELQTLKNRLADQRKIVEANKKETDKLLKDTKNQESTYKKLVADKEAKRKAFEQEINNYEAQLKLIIDPKSFPSPGTGALSWPTDIPLITQQFGDTEFSRSNPQAYNGKGHNGIDLRATPGTPIKAAALGVVIGTGDTDSVCPGASYGKWVLIKHPIGLTTLYAHLSLVKVGSGQNVVSGELIGYGGSTGYATGPHLHFALFASQGVEIRSLKSRVCGGTYTLPVADLKAYLNPLLYL